MANFEVKVVRIDDVIEHPNADRLTIVKIGGYNCIANKKEDGSWRYQPGNPVIYIPEGAVVPPWMLKSMDMWDDVQGKGGLAGSRGDRVKAIKLRGIVSQGLLYPTLPVPVEYQNSEKTLVSFNGYIALHGAEIGEDVAETLGITKYEPPIPVAMAGEVFSCFPHQFVYDIENIQKYPEVFRENEDVVMTEKLHGTFCCIVVDPEYNFDHGFGNSNITVSSKGLMGKGLFLKNNEANNNNLYVRIVTRYLDAICENIQRPLYLMGEIYGKGVQDLQYGMQDIDFRLFDVYDYNAKTFIEHAIVQTIADKLGMATVPEIYRGPFTQEALDEATTGKDTINGVNVREGVVIRPEVERRHDELGRVILKSVSQDYLLRKGGTEYN